MYNLNNKDKEFIERKVIFLLRRIKKNLYSQYININNG